jgi:hypothetical protein
MVNILLLVSCALLYYTIKNNLYNNSSNKENFIIYGIFIVVLLQVAIPTEKSDMTCPNGPYTINQKLCRDGNGKLFQVGKYKKTDNVNTVLDKMNKLIINKQTQVYWRRFFILSFILTIVSHYLITNKLPDGKMFIILFIVLYLGVTNMNSFYVYHYDNHFDKRLVHGIQKVKRLIVDNQNLANY